MAVLWTERGNGTATVNVAFAFPLTGQPAPFTYLFVIRNQNGGTFTPVNMVQVGTDAGVGGNGRMSVWRVTGANPTLTATGATALINWNAVGIEEEAQEVQFAYAAANTTAAMPAPAAFTTQGKSLVCWGANNFTTFVDVATVLAKDTHTETRPSTMVSYLDSPVPVANRGDTASRIESVAALRMAPSLEFVAFVEGHNTTGDVNMPLTVPASVRVGDYGVWVTGLDSSSAFTGTQPAGWTPLIPDTVAVNSNWRIVGKFYEASDGATVAWIGSPPGMVAGIAWFRNVARVGNVSTPWTRPVSGNTMTCPSVVRSAPKSTILAIGGERSIAATAGEVGYASLVGARFLASTPGNTTLNSSNRIAQSWFGFKAATDPEGVATWTMNDSSANGMGVQIELVPVPSISTLTDDFSNGLTKWPGSYGPITTPGGGEAVIRRDDPPNYSALYTSPTKYDARNGEFIVRMRLPGVGSGGREFGAELRVDGANFLQFYCSGFPSTISAIIRENGTPRYIGQIALPAQTVWLRYSIANSVVSFAISTDRTNWTSMGSGTPAFSLASVEAHLLAGAWQAEGTFDTGFAYVNTVPTSLPTGEIWNGTRWISPEMGNGTRWVTGNEIEIWNGTRWVKMGT